MGATAVRSHWAVVTLQQMTLLRFRLSRLSFTSAGPAVADLAISQSVAQRHQGAQSRALQSHISQCFPVDTDCSLARVLCMCRRADRLFRPNGRIVSCCWERGVSDHVATRPGVFTPMFCSRRPTCTGDAAARAERVVGCAVYRGRRLEELTWRG